MYIPKTKGARYLPVFFPDLKAIGKHLELGNIYVSPYLRINIFTERCSSCIFVTLRVYRVSVSRTLICTYSETCWGNSKIQSTFHTPHCRTLHSGYTLTFTLSIVLLELFFSFALYPVYSFIQNIIASRTFVSNFPTTPFHHLRLINPKYGRRTQKSAVHLVIEVFSVLLTSQLFQLVSL